MDYLFPDDYDLIYISKVFTDTEVPPLPTNDPRIKIGGTGFFLTNGTYTSIKWSADSSGILNFYLENNERLYINIGNSYIGFFKSSSTSSVLFK